MSLGKREIPTRERLLEAALALVAKGGIAAVSHRTVEEAAGAARGSTRYHFGSRDGLLEALLGHVAHRDLAAVAAAWPDRAPEREAVVEALGRVLRSLTADRTGAMARVELYLHAARRPELRPALERWARGFTEPAAQVLRALDVPDPDARARELVAAMDGVALHALIDQRVDADEVAARLLSAAGVR